MHSYGRPKTRIPDPQFISLSRCTGFPNARTGNGNSSIQEALCLRPVFRMHHRWRRGGLRMNGWQSSRPWSRNRCRPRTHGNPAHAYHPHRARQTSRTQNLLRVNESRVKELCATTFAIFTNQKITIRSANCGSMVSSVSINPGKRNCVLVTEVLRGCGSGIYSESRNARDGVGSNTTENCLAMTFNHGLLKARTATVDRPRTDDIRQSRGTRRA